MNARTLRIFCLAALSCWGAKAWADRVSVDGVVYETDYNEPTATVRAVEASDVVIPETFVYNGTSYAVTGFDGDAFKNYSELRSVDLRTPLTELPDGFFENCEGLVSVALPATLEAIGENAFSGCRSLTAIELPDGVERMGNNCFSGCSSLREIGLPASLAEIPENAFRNCESLTSFTLPPSVEVVGDWAFEGCPNLRSLTLADGSKPLRLGVGMQYIPLSALYLGRNIEMECWGSPFDVSALTTATVGPQARKIPSAFFQNAKMLSELSIEEGVKTIGDMAFYGCESLTSIALPQSVDSVGREAFSYCTSLASVSLSGGLRATGEYMFNACTALSDIVLPEGLEKIGENTFAGCTALAEIAFPSTLDSIGDNAFYGCRSLSSIGWPEGLEYVGGAAFCETVIAELDLPDGVKHIGPTAFAHCKSLKTVSLGKGVAYIGDGAFYDLKMDEVRYRGTLADWCKIWFDASSYQEDTSPLSNAKAFYVYDEEAEDDVLLTSVVIPEGVDSIPAFAFAMHRGITQVDIPASVQYVGQYAFDSCPITEAVIRAAVIHEGAFLGIRANELTLGSGLKQVDENAFYRYSGLFNALRYEGDVKGWCSIQWGYRANPGCQNLYVGGELQEDIVLPPTVHAVGDYAFYDCAGVKSVELSLNT